MSKTVTRREWKQERKNDRRALKLQATEYKRRLKSLNGEQNRIANAAAQSVRKDVYDSNQKALDDRLKALEAQENRRAGALRLIAVLAAGGLLSGLLGLWQQVRTPTPTPAPQVYVPAVPGTMVPSPTTTPPR